MTSWYKRSDDDFSWEKSLLDEINEVITEPIEAIVMGKSPKVPENLQDRILTLAEAARILTILPAIVLNTTQNSMTWDLVGFELPSINIYTASWVYITVGVDSDWSLIRVRRNPIDGEPPTTVVL